ncbi:MAG: SusC/RagA family TonB-linked outer membrane protein [Flavisolibacter sp.]
MRKFLSLAFLNIGLLLLCFSGHAQERNISGMVLSGDGNTPMPGVTVTVTGTNKSTQTDGEGKFIIAAQTGQTLHFSHVGYTAQDVVVGKESSISITLATSQGNAMEDVVVVGYGTQRKANLTGAVSTVDVAKTFGSKPLNDPTKALQGVVPGLTITYGNGGLTTAPTINIRGVGSINGSGRPLILVDNVETPDLSVINPNDIESISVLKDAASTSIYGARAAFGVVLIKTKSGKKNQKTSITYNNFFAWSKPTTLPDFSNPVPELEALYNASQRGGITSPETFGMQLSTLRDGIANWQKNYASTNTGSEMIKGQDFDFVNGRVYFYKVWDPKKVMLKDYTQSQMHNIKIQGGGENVGYYMSFGYGHDGGILKMNPDDVKKYNITAAINASPTKWLDVDMKMLYRNFDYDYPYGYQDYWYYFWRWGAYFPYGTWNGNYFHHTPAYMAGANTNSVVDNYQRVDIGATAKITNHLNIRADYTIGRDNALRHEVGGPIMAWDFWSAGVPPKLANIALASQDVASYTTGRFMTNTFNSYATYEDKFGAHNIKVMAGINAEDNESFNIAAAKKGLLDPSKGELGLTYGDPTVSDTHGLNAYAGYFGRINYNYKGKYLLELNGRYDGASSYSPRDRWAFFPSASVGYRVSEESFMNFSKPVLNDWKIRASYGELGNQDVGGNKYLALMRSSSAGWIDGTALAQTLQQPISVPDALTWESVKTLDLGSDLKLFNNHIGASFDWYERTTRGMIASTSVPATFGVSGPFNNSGDFRTRGWELSLDANYPVGKDINLYGTLTLADNKTIFTKWDNPSMLIMQNYVGKTYGEIWGFETDRYFTSDEDVQKSPSQTTLQNGNFVFGAGDVKYKDLNGDGIINGGKMTLADHGDLKVIGNTQPRYIYSARIGGSWKNFDLDVFVQGVGKRSFWGLGQTAIPLYQNADILYQNQLDFWLPTHTDAFYPRPYIGNNATKLAGMPTSGNNFYPQTKYMQNLAYCRLKNVSIGYTLPKNLLSRYYIQGLRVYVSGENLGEISNVGIPLDPEITDGYLNYLGRTFPFQRMYSFGVQVNF